MQVIFVDKNGERKGGMTHYGSIPATLIGVHVTFMGNIAPCIFLPDWIESIVPEPEGPGFAREIPIEVLAEIKDRAASLGIAMSAKAMAMSMCK